MYFDKIKYDNHRYSRQASSEPGGNNNHPDFARMSVVLGSRTPKVVGVDNVAGSRASRSKMPNRSTSTIVIELILNIINMLHNTITPVWDENSTTN